MFIGPHKNKVLHSKDWQRSYLGSKVLYNFIVLLLLCSCAFSKFPKMIMYWYTAYFYKMHEKLYYFIRSIGEGNGNPLQYSCLENSMDREAWQAMVHRVTESQTWLKQLSTAQHIRDINFKNKPNSCIISLPWIITFL